MSKLPDLSPLFKTLRFRLALWFTISLSFIVILLATYLYIQLRRSLIAQVDVELNLAAAQAESNLEARDGQLTFRNRALTSVSSRNFNDDFIVQLLAQDGTLWDSLGGEDDAPSTFLQPGGFSTVDAVDEQWRLYSQEVRVGETAGFLQVLQELEPVKMTLQSLLAQMFLGVPLAILLAGLGGFILARRALLPVDRITQTAQSITSSDLGGRIGHKGPADEIGRLAETMDDMLDRLQEAFERERRFTGDAAHELRTPLAALKGRIGVTLSQPREASDYSETLQDMEHQVDRLIHLSNDLLYMARLDRGQRNRIIERIEVGDLLASVVDQVRPLAETKSIQLEQEIPGGMEISGNIDLLIRLFLNLLDNAIKFTGPEGTVSVWAKEESHEVQIGVTDTGPGIVTEHLPHLFDRFYRAEEDRARIGNDNGRGGAGLGLAIAYEIARLHDGQLTVQSEIGRGTTFTLHMPAVVHSANIEKA